MDNIVQRSVLLAMALEKQMQNLTLRNTGERHTATLLDLFACYPVRERICFYSSIEAIIALSRTCKSLSGTYRDLLPTQWNIDARLSRFVADPCGLRLQLRDRRAVISGSFAVQFFDRTVYPDSDLEIFVQHGDHGQGFQEYLTTAEGYDLEHAKAKLQHTDEDPDLYTLQYGDRRSEFQSFGVRTLSKESVTYPLRLRIQIFETWELPIISVLSRSYATHVVNLITWSRAYAIFPIPTFMQHKGYMLEDPSHNYLSSRLRKWATRGWGFDQTLWPEQHTPSHSIRTRRRIGDKFTWKIAHDTTGLKLPNRMSEDDHGMQNNVFEMQNLASHYCLDILGGYDSPVLRNKYIIPCSSWLDFLDVRLSRATYMQVLTKLPPANWPGRSMIRAQDSASGYVSYMQKVGHLWMPSLTDENESYFDRPQHWRFYDDKIPGWYDAWNQRQTREDKAREKDVTMNRPAYESGWMGDHEYSERSGL